MEQHQRRALRACLWIFLALGIAEESEALLTREFRIVLPMTVDEFRVGQLYSVAEYSKGETGGGEGVEVVTNEPFEGESLFGGKYTKGQYTHKVYHLASKVPKTIRLLAPTGSLEVHEKSWNAYPYCKTELSNPYMKDKFSLTIETFYNADRGQSENILEMPAETLNTRQVQMIDIGNDPVSAMDYKPDQDPSNFTSVKTGRGPLSGEWQQQEPAMTAYKLVTVEFVWFGLQERMEKTIMKALHRLFFNFHRAAFCWIDAWYGMTMDAIRELEEKTKHDLDQQRQEGDVTGMVVQR